MTPHEFDAMVAPFLELQDDQQPGEFYHTDWDMATQVVGCLRTFLFHAEIAKEERRKQYRALKEEFEAEIFGPYVLRTSNQQPPFRPIAD